jgi:hypothetical protein
VYQEDALDSPILNDDRRLLQCGHRRKDKGCQEEEWVHRLGFEFAAQKNRRAYKLSSHWPPKACRVT